MILLEVKEIIKDKNLILSAEGRDSISAVDLKQNFYCQGSTIIHLYFTKSIPKVFFNRIFA